MYDRMDTKTVQKILKRLSVDSDSFFEDRYDVYWIRLLTNSRTMVRVVSFPKNVMAGSWDTGYRYHLSDRSWYMSDFAEGLRDGYYGQLNERQARRCGHVAKAYYDWRVINDLL